MGDEQQGFSSQGCLAKRDPSGQASAGGTTEGGKARQSLPRKAEAFFIFSEKGVFWQALEKGDGSGFSGHAHASSGPEGCYAFSNRQPAVGAGAVTRSSSVVSEEASTTRKVFPPAVFDRYMASSACFNRTAASVP